jgi:hypothetical protein
MDDFWNLGFMSMSAEWDAMLDQDSDFYQDNECDSLDELLE